MSGHNDVFEWTPERKDVLIKYYSLNGSAFCAEKLGTTRKRVTAQAFKLGLKLDRMVRSDLQSKGMEKLRKHERKVQRKAVGARWQYTLELMREEMPAIEQLALCGRRVESLVGSGELCR